MWIRNGDPLGNFGDTTLEHLYRHTIFHRDDSKHFGVKSGEIVFAAREAFRQRRHIHVCDF